MIYDIHFFSQRTNMDMKLAINIDDYFCFCFFPCFSKGSIHLSLSP